VGAFRSLHEKVAGGSRVDAFAGTNFRMNEFCGGVLLAQLRKLDRIVLDARTNARRVYDAIRDLPSLKLRRLPDPDGELGAGIYLGFQSKDQRDRFAAAMKEAYVPVAPPVGSVLLPTQEYIERKRTVHPAWPSFTSERGRSIQYGAACCPRTIDILNRYAGVLMDPKFTKRDTDDIVAAIRRAYPTIG
jgi:dTDP-4-amino-4,6-dideoxygalactose transaminase